MNDSELKSYAQAIIKMFIFSLILFFMLLSFILYTGQTFSQRCSKKYEKDSVEWGLCVKELSNGLRDVP